jgi:hypothetical protein
MTPARQPQHCEHECVCGRFGISAIPFSFPCPANINKDYDDCEHDTRPAPLAPESLCEGFTAEDEMCGKVPSECYSRYQENIEKAKAHDAQVAKSERERVWGKLIAHHAGCWYKKGKDEHQSWVDSIESLRGAQEEQGGSER